MGMSDYMQRLRARVGHELLGVPAVTVVIRDAEGRVLLARHHSGVWVLPGGAIEPEETPADAAVRETFEETGLVVRLVRIVGVYGGPECTVEYANGDRTSYVMVVFEAEAFAGTPRPDGDEVLELDWLAVQELEGRKLAAWMPELLPALRGEGDGRGFRPPTWAPSASDLAD